MSSSFFLPLTAESLVQLDAAFHAVRAFGLMECEAADDANAQLPFVLRLSIGKIAATLQSALGCLTPWASAWSNRLLSHRPHALCALHCLIDSPEFAIFNHEK